MQGYMRYNLQISEDLMFTDCEPEPMDEREDLEECVMAQILSDITSGLVMEVLGSLTKLNENALLEFLPLDHPVWQGRRQRLDTQNALLMPPYVVESLNPKVASQFLWSHN